MCVQPARQEYGGLQAPAQHYDASNPFAIPPPGSGHASPYLQRVRGTFISTYVLWAYGIALVDALSTPNFIVILLSV